MSLKPDGRFAVASRESMDRLAGSLRVSGGAEEAGRRTVGCASATSRALLSDAAGDGRWRAVRRSTSVTTG
jgi:hypothetical protein